MAVLLCGCQTHRVLVVDLAQEELSGRTVTVAARDGSRVTGVVRWVTRDSLAVVVGGIGSATMTEHTFAIRDIDSIAIDERQYVGYVLGTVLLLSAIALFYLEFVFPPFRLS